MLRLTLLAAAATAAAAQSSGCTTGDNSFDNLLLVEQWPGTVGVSVTGNYFTLHGLWPSRSDPNAANYPCTCTSQTFDETAVASIRTDLNTYWPSSQGSDVDFWTHEYTKHGTCAESISSLSTELGFMSGALHLRASLNTYAKLAAQGVTPSATATYTMKQFTASVSHRTIFKCDSQNRVQEVATCWSKSLTQIDCDADAYSGSTCPSTGILLPPTSSTPSGGQCVADKHGPACTSDAQCKQYSDCVRCASSGFCTLQPSEDKVDVAVKFSLRGVF